MIFEEGAKNPRRGKYRLFKEGDWKPKTNNFKEKQHLKKLSKHFIVVFAEKRKVFQIWKDLQKSIENMTALYKSVNVHKGAQC